MAINAVFDDRHFEHLAGAGAVNVSALFKHLLPPGFPGVPGDHPGFDSGEVRDQKPSTLFRDERGPDQLAERVWHIFI